MTDKNASMMKNNAPCVLNHPLKDMVLQYKRGIKQGITSVCSSNPFVVEAAMENAMAQNAFVLLEATANQVDQFGGYSGMTPKDFAGYARRTACRLGFDQDRLILGGDHLGPLTWSKEHGHAAMDNAKELVRQYVLAGFTKIHLDTSMKLVGDSKDERLSDEVIARRGAALCAAAEDAYKELLKTDPCAIAPVYVVGSEVPIPGGVGEDEGLRVTKQEDFESAVATYEAEFDRQGLSEAWVRVIAVVVQPGVEFGDTFIHEYDRNAASNLSKALEKYPNLVFEGHSTDYQTPNKLREMVEDGIMILKVGPGLTYAFREALFMLEHVEKELFSKTGIHLSNFANVLDNEMLKNPDKWKAYYHGSENELSLKRRFSLSDRCRYYLTNSEVEKSIGRLMDNLNSADIPATILSQYMPAQYNKMREGMLKGDPVSLVKDRIKQCLNGYAYGCCPSRNN